MYLEIHKLLPKCFLYRYVLLNYPNRFFFFFYNIIRNILKYHLSLIFVITLEPLYLVFNYFTSLYFNDNV
jgi:hypothetical protein